MPKIFVITPVHDVPMDHLSHCYDSVRKQTLRATHIVIHDGHNHTNVPPLAEECQVIQIPGPHNDVGNCARAIGAIHAICVGADAVAFLDADNYYHPEHLERCWIALASQGLGFVSTNRYLITLDGEMLGQCTENDGENHVDTSCMFFGRKGLGSVAGWYLCNPNHRGVADRVVFQWAKGMRIPRVHLDQPTVYYRTKYAAHYRQFDRRVPQGAKENVVLTAVPVTMETK